MRQKNRVTRLINIISGALWILAVLHIMFPQAPIAPFLVGLLICFVLGAVPQLSLHTRVLCGALAMATVIIAWLDGQWSAIPDGLAKATVFPAFLSTIVLLRATADQRPEIITAREMFGALDPTKRDSGIVIGTHLIGAILQVGVFAILAPILNRGASSQERRELFTVAIRGMGTVPFWSPFVVGMAVASQYLPMVPLWNIMPLGIIITILSVVISVVIFDRNPELKSIKLALRSFLPVAFPIFIAALLVVGTTATTSLTTLQALILSVPIPCLLAVMQIPGGSVRRALHQTTSGIGQIGPVTSILACSTMLGAVFEAALPNMGLINFLRELALPSAVIIFIVILTINIAGLFGIHPIVTGTILLVIFTSIPTGLNDLILMQSILVGWGLCSVISIGSLTIATGAAMFQIPPTDLITKTNIAYVFLTSIIVGAVLAGLNTLIS